MTEKTEHKKFTFDFQGEKIIFEIDQLAIRSEKSILCRYGNTVVLTTLCVQPLEEKNELNFVPLSVSFEGKFYSINKIPNVFDRREGKPDYKLITVARLIDRSLRSFFDLENQQKIQITNSVLSFDQQFDPRVVACWNSILVSFLSPQLPYFNQLLATVVIAKVEEKFVCNPSIDQTKKSSFELIITATEEKIVMIELGAEGITEEELEKAVIFAQKKIKEIISFFKKIASEINDQKRQFPPLEEIKVEKDLEQRIKKSLNDICLAADDWLVKDRKLSLFLQELKKDNTEEVKIEQVWNLICQKWTKESFQETQQRVDGRKKEDIRSLNIQMNYLPNVDGSALFQRGETQVLSVVTLGKISERQLVDNIFDHTHKHFIHHYNFPSFAVGEIATFKTISRREIGHGQLVEKTFSLLPSVNVFPYTIRVVSEVLSSNGSSSQASICATSLALIAAGVPLKTPIAGIALGLLGEEIIVDINDWEDKFGEMDCKIAGSEEIFSCQLDVKNKGIDFLTFQKSLKKGKKARLYLLKKMSDYVPKFRSLSARSIKFRKIFVGTGRFGIVVGAQGKNINFLSREMEVSVDLQPDGHILFYHQEEKQLTKAIEFIQNCLERKR